MPTPTIGCNPVQHPTVTIKPVREDLQFLADLVFCVTFELLCWTVRISRMVISVGFGFSFKIKLLANLMISTLPDFSSQYVQKAQKN